MSSPARSEAFSEPITFECRGESYTVPPQNEWPPDVYEAFEDERIIAGLRALLGPQQWKLFKQRVRGPDVFSEMYEAIGAAAGMGEGGSLASSA